MSKATKYLLVSLPNSISPSNDHDEALTALRSAVLTDYGTVYPFSIPEFKIGTLDALVQQADELAKLEGVCQGVVTKVGESLGTLLEGDEDKIVQQKTVNDSQSSLRYTVCSSANTLDCRTCGSVFANLYMEQSQVPCGQACWRPHGFSAKGSKASPQRSALMEPSLPS